MNLRLSQRAVDETGRLGPDSSPLTYGIIGAMMEVHSQLGHGFLEAVYQQALAIELDSRGIPFEREVDLPISYKGVVLPTRYRADFVCGGKVILELKAQSSVSVVEDAQVIHYLRATGLRVGLLANFGRKSLDFKRYVEGPDEVEIETI